MGSFEKEGAVNVTDTVVPVPRSVAVPIVGAVEGPLVEPCDPRIGILLFYLTLFLVIIDVAEHF